MTSLRDLLAKARTYPQPRRHGCEQCHTVFVCEACTQAFLYCRSNGLIILYALGLVRGGKESNIPGETMFTHKADRHFLCEKCR